MLMKNILNYSVAELRLMRNLFLSLLVVLGVIGMQAEVVHVQTPGTLQDVLMDMDFSASQLTITGTLNAADLSYIHKGTGRLANVTVIDISGITVIPSDKSYVSECLGVEQGSTNSRAMGSFYYSNENRCDTIESTNMLGVSSVHYKVYGNRLAGLFRATHYKKVVLPKELDRIGCHMFECSAVEEAPIPEACKEVEAWAFSNSKVTSVKLPPTCTSVGGGAFSGSSLKSINLENVCKLGKNAFYESTLEGAVQLGKVEEIPGGCFSGTGITSVKLQKGLVSIGGYAFSRTKIPSIVLPDGLETLGGGTFSNCKELKIISVPQSVTFIGSHAFPEDWVLTQKSEDGVYYIGKVAYSFAETAKGMTELNFKDGTVSLSSNLCDAIGSSSYDGAAGKYFKESLVSVDIPASVKSIGDSNGYNGIFGGCENLATVTLHEGLKSIGKGTFEDCSSLKNITLPLSLEYIGYEAFKNTGITSMTWGENMKIVDDYAFSGCNSLVSLRIESKKLSDKNFVFSASSLEKVVFGPKVEYIPEFLFKDNKSLVRIVFEEDDSNTVPLEIGRDAFCGCTALKIGKMPKRLVKIGRFAFENCNFSEEKFSSQNIEFMDCHAFAYCKGLKYVELNPALKYCDSAFEGIGDLKEVRYDAVESESGSVFRDSGIEKVTIGSHERKIGGFSNIGNSITLEFEDRTANGEDDCLDFFWRSFYGTKIANLVLPDVPTKIGKEAFSGCGIETLRLGLGTDSIDDSAFYGNMFEVLDVPPTLNYMGYYRVGYGSNVIMHTMTSPKEWNKGYYSSGAVLYYPKGCVYTGNQRFNAYKEYEIRVSESSVKLDMGETVQINGSVIVEDADPDVYEQLSHIVWESSDPSVATVDESGKITAVGNGTAIITAYSSYKDGYGAKCLVTAGGISGIAETGMSDDVKVSANNGIVTVSGVDANSVVTVWSVDGKKVLRTKEKTITGLASDLYIISVGNKNFKVKL